MGAGFFRFQAIHERRSMINHVLTKNHEKYFVVSRGFCIFAPDSNKK